MIIFENVSKKFGTGVFGLSNISFDVQKGEFVFLVGPTGSGKTTLFRLLIRDSLPTEGKISINDDNISGLAKQKISDLRRKVGVVFQDLKLLTDRTVFENVSLPLDVVGEKSQEVKDKVEDILKQVGILEHRDKFPVQLSGGELQRVAIARALILDPEVLLADEPTGNLDPATSWEIIKLLTDINKSGTTIIMATHNADIVKSMNKRVIELDRGEVVKDHKRSPDKQEEEPESKKKDKEEKDDKPEKEDKKNKEDKEE